MKVFNKIISLIKPKTVNKVIDKVADNAEDKRKYKIIVLILLGLLGLFGVIGGSDLINLIESIL